MCLEADVIKSIIYLDCITQISAFVSQQSHILEESVALVFLITSCKRIIVAVARVAVKVHQGKHYTVRKAALCHGDLYVHKVAVFPSEPSPRCLGSKIHSAFYRLNLATCH